MGFLGLGGGASTGGVAPQMAGGMSTAVMGFPSVAMGGQAQAQPKKKSFRDSGFANFLGVLGDAMLAASGRPMIYSPMREQRMQQERQEQANAAIANYLGNLDPGLRDLVTQAGPQAAMSAYGLMHPKDTKSGFARELADLGFSPDEAKGIARRRYTRPIIMGSAATGYGILDDEGGDIGDAGGGEPTVDSQEGYDALPPGSFYLDAQGNRRQKTGGPAATPPATFSR